MVTTTERPTMTKSSPISLIFAALMLSSGMSQGLAQTAAFTVTLDEAANGSVTLNPALPADGKYAAGTVITVTATPDPGFEVDAVYYSVSGQWGPMYHDTPSVSTLEVTVDQDKHVGAYFIEA